MSKVTLALHLGLPLYPNRAFPYDRAKRIAEEATLMDKYFDYGLSHRMYLDEYRWIYSPLLEGFKSAIDELQKSGSNFKFALCISGLLLEQMLKEDRSLINTITAMVNSGSVEMLTTPFYNSPSSVYPSGTAEFEEQVKEHQQLIKKVFSADTNILVNSKLIYSDRVAKAAEALALKGVIVDEVPNLNVHTSGQVYSSAVSPGIKLLVRDLKSSLALIRGELSTHQLLQQGYHLLYLEGRYLPRASPIVYRNLALSFVQAGIETVLPYEVAEESIPSGSVSVPEPMNIATSEVDGDFSTLIRNPMQRMYHDRLFSLQPYVNEVNDQRIKGIWRLMQQVDFLAAMDERNSEDTESNFSSAYEAFAVLNTILVDFEGKVATLVQRIRKAKMQAQQKLMQAQQLAAQQQLQQQTIAQALQQVKQT
ncbi:MAG: hypothetical protein QXV32_07430 [Conexivisphaerales archaeon]